jgi:hypothetical protein
VPAALGGGGGGAHSHDSSTDDHPHVSRGPRVGVQISPNWHRGGGGEGGNGGGEGGDGGGDGGDGGDGGGGRDQLDQLQISCTVCTLSTPAQWSTMQVSIQKDSGRSQASAPHATSPAARAAGEHAGGSSRASSSSQERGSASSSGAQHESRCSGPNIHSVEGSGCRSSAQFLNVGECARRPSRLPDAASSPGNVIRAAPDVSWISPHESSAIVCPTSKIRVREGSDTLVETAARTMHETLV